MLFVIRATRKPMLMVFRATRKLMLWYLEQQKKLMLPIFIATKKPMLKVNRATRKSMLQFPGPIFFGNFGFEPNFPTKLEKTKMGMDFLVALITISIDFFVALNIKHEFSCCSKYH